MKDATARIEKIKKQVAPPPTVTGSDRRILEESARVTARPQILQVREDLDAAALPIVREANAAADLAKVQAERTWDKFSVLRRATSGSNDPVGDLSRRHSLTELLTLAGPVELTAWAQAAIDTGNLLLADVVARCNGSRPIKEQPFGNLQFLDKLPMAEYTEAQALLDAVIADAKRIGLAYSEFSNDVPGAASLAQISLGLAERQRAKDAAAGNLLDARTRGEQV